MDSHIHVLGLKPSLRLSKFVRDKFVRLWETTYPPKITYTG